MGDNAAAGNIGCDVMRTFPIAPTMSLDVGVIHFVGIGGIGMSGIAEVLHNQGYKVQGSDISDGANINRLQELGIKIFIGQREENVENASVVVKSTAVKMDNPEIMAARKKRIPVVRRSEMLAELMRMKICVAIAGTHGKTTTTSLTAALFEAGGLNPTVINGGIINAYGTNAKVGSGDWMVVEADESDGTFTRLPISIGVVTNIDPEHLDYYGDFVSLKQAFMQFLENLPFYGFAVLCIDHHEVQNLISEVCDRRIISYGISPQADVRACNIQVCETGQKFTLQIKYISGDTGYAEYEMFLPMHGEHNLRNALAAIAIAAELGMPINSIKKALADFSGVKRRFTHIGEVNGVHIIDDYGHHPVEIAATLSSARQAVETTGGKVIAVVQPHRYSRVQNLFNEFCTCFNDADMVLVADIFAAGEEKLADIDNKKLAAAIAAAGHQHVEALESPEALPIRISKLAKPGDYVICLGAGNITVWANKLPQQLTELAG